MGRCLGIDYGSARTGLAISDELGMVASPLETVATAGALLRIAELIKQYRIAMLVVGEARYLNGQASDATRDQAAFTEKLRKQFPELEIERENEMFTSSIAARSLVQAGVKKSERAQKGRLDMVSAAIILQSYLDRKKS
jgi:putative holliday junction resolvase